MLGRNGHWLAFGVLVHTAFFFVAGLTAISVIDSLISHGNLSWAPHSAAQHLSLGWNAPWIQRHFPFALCVLPNLALLPAAFSLWATLAALAGRRLDPGQVASRALLYAIAAFAIYIVSIFVMLKTISFRIGTFGNLGLFWFTTAILIWDFAIVFTAPLAHRIVEAAAGRWGGRLPPGSEPAQ